jgi:hypothetical protein
VHDVVSPPFSVALRLSLEVGRETAEREDASEVGLWRDELVPVALREPTSRRLPDNVQPTKEQAIEVLSATLANHPMANVARRAGSPVVDTGRRRTPMAYVIAEVALVPSLAPVEPGGEFPDVTDDIVGDAVLVHATPWRHEPGSHDERNAADVLLQQIVAELPPALWHQDG